MSTLGRLRQLEQEATAGEWYADRANVPYPSGVLPMCVRASEKLTATHDVVALMNNPKLEEQDAALIAAMRNALPGLLRVAEAAEWFVRAQDDVDMVDEVKAFIELQASLRALDGEGSGEDE